METKVATLTGTGRVERTPERVTNLNGYRERSWEYVRQHSPKSFNELASVYEHRDHDPAYWSPPVWMLPWKRIRQKPDRPTAWVPGQPGTSVAGSRRS
jgi:hypothetical protein